METTVMEFQPCNAPHLKLTPNFQPAMGITPMTQIVVQQMDRLARKPITIFMVERDKMGKARHTPMTIPFTALSARL
jgi:hypothetical protein